MYFVQAWFNLADDARDKPSRTLPLFCASRGDSCGALTGAGERSAIVWLYGCGDNEMLGKEPNLKFVGALKFKGSDVRHHALQ